MAYVITVHSCCEFRVDHVQTAIQCRGQTEVFLVVLQSDSGIIICLDQRDRRIRRGVIDDQELKIPISLLQDTLQGFAYKFLAVIDSHEDGYPRLF